MITSKLTSKAQTTIPQPIRAALRLREGDELVYEIQGDRVVLSRAQRVRAGDVPITDLALAGLPAPSLIRAAIGRELGFQD